MELIEILVIIMVALNIIMGAIIVIILRNNRKSSVKADSRNAVANQNRLEDQEQEQCEKTVVLNRGKAQMISVGEANNVSDEKREILNEKIEPVPKLTQTQKTEILRIIEKESTPKSYETEVFNRDVYNKPLALLKYRVNGQEKTYEMRTEFINIGRDEEICDVVISEDNFVSKHHAIIFKKGQRFYIVDVNSRNGTYVDDERVVGCKELKQGAKIRLAKTEMEFLKQ